MHKEENTMYKLFYSNEMEIGNYLHFFISTNFPTAFTLSDFNNIANFRIGSFNDSANNGTVGNFHGAIDGLSIWDKILTQSEITQLYNSGNGKHYPFT